MELPSSGCEPLLKADNFSHKCRDEDCLMAVSSSCYLCNAAEEEAQAFNFRQSWGNLRSASGPASEDQRPLHDGFMHLLCNLDTLQALSKDSLRVHCARDAQRNAGALLMTMRS